MLIEKSQVVIGAVTAAVVAAGTVFAVGATAGMFEPGDDISADFTDAAALQTGDFVFVAGHRAGRVSNIELDGATARVDFTLTAPEIPADSTVDIILQSTLGRRALKVTPGTSSQMLQDGDHIPVERTGTPVDLPELGDRSAELLGGVDVEALQDLTTALADVTDGAADDVEALLVGVEDVTRIVSERRDEIESVLENAEIVVDAAAQKDQEIVTIIDEFGSVLNRLVDRRDDISRLLAETARSSTVTADLVDERRDQIDRVLTALHQDLQIVDDHQVDLAHTLTTMAAGLEGFASIGYQQGDAKVDNPHWGNVFTTGLGSIGVGALMDCGGAIDELFTDVIGPDPRCEEIEGDQRSPGDGPPRDDRDPGDSETELPPLEPDELIDSLTRGQSGAEGLGSFLEGPGGAL
jgi:phospholipid/cholesterol/gamma-HCH transport system substrate-binding protein